ncbi:MAG TPA: energy transducer TonB [Candidatus Baltobacteraceae bacterium]|nr:energy transducer TonB [Candidatus Baltobacteraceae bacterium]
MHTANIGVFDEAIWQGHADPTALHPQTTAEAQATFLRGMLDIPSQHAIRNPAEWLISLAAHVVIVGAVLIAPLLFTQVLDLHSFQAVFLVAPRPPAAAPPPAPAQALRTARPLAQADISKLTAPAVIPAKVRIVADAAAPDLGSEASGGVPGGVPGGVLGGIIGGTADAAPNIAPPPPAARRIVRVGGDVKPPVPISTPDPRYPAIALAAHIEGTVIIDAIIDEQGNVVQERLVEGPPLLVAAALDAVSQWKYQPTYLNGQAVAINTHVQVTFRLH